jgi:hypothetical protein
VCHRPIAKDWPVFLSLQEDAMAIDVRMIPSSRLSPWSLAAQVLARWFMVLLWKTHWRLHQVKIKPDYAEDIIERTTMSLYDSSMGLMVVGTVLLVFSGFYLLLRQGTDMAHEIISLVFIAGVAIIMGGSLMMIFIKLKNKPDVTLPCILIHLSSLLLSFY